MANKWPARNLHTGNPHALLNIPKCDCNVYVYMNITRIVGNYSLMIAHFIVLQMQLSMSLPTMSEVGAYVHPKDEKCLAMPGLV